MEALFSKVAEKSGKTESEIKKLVEGKMLELSGLVSEAGALHIVAKELGVDLLEKVDRRLMIKNIVPNINSLNIYGMVTRIFEPKEFQKKDGTKGKIASFILADESGSVRVVLWNDQVELSEKLNEGMVIELSRAFSKDGYNGGAEVRIGRTTTIAEKKDADLPPLEELKKESAITPSASRMNMRELREGTFAEVRACIAQIFENPNFYEVCPKCETRTREEGGKFRCPEHGDIKPKFHMAISGVLDDGTGNIRASFFRENAEKIAGMTADKGKENPDEIRNLIKKSAGNEFVFRGRVRRNDMFNRIEMTVSSISDIDPLEESEKIMGLLERM